MPASGFADDAVTPLVKKAAAWSWRLVAIGALAWMVLEVVKRLEVIVVPVAIALMVAALLVPAVDWLDRRGAPRGGAVALVLLTAFGVVGGLLSFVISQFVEGMPGLIQQVTASIDKASDWLTNGPLNVAPGTIDRAGQVAIEALQRNQEKLTTGALSTAATITEIVTGALLVFFTLIFLLYGGRNIWHFVTRAFPGTVQQRVREAGIAGFGSLVGYVRATFLVALVDAIGIGTGLAIMSVPLALPLASLVFMGAFIPLVGAVITGFVAVIVALLAKGFVVALITLGLIIGVQQLEAHVLQPLVMGRAVSIHPLAVVLAIATGGVLAGIVGALLAVPLVAFGNSAVRVLLAPDPVAEQEQLAEGSGEDAVISAKPDDPDDAWVPN